MCSIFGGSFSERGSAYGCSILWSSWDNSGSSWRQLNHHSLWNWYHNAKVLDSQAHLGFRSFVLNIRLKNDNHLHFLKFRNDNQRTKVTFLPAQLEQWRWMIYSASSINKCLCGFSTVPDSVHMRAWGERQHALRVLVFTMLILSHASHSDNMRLCFWKEPQLHLGIYLF